MKNFYFFVLLVFFSCADQKQNRDAQNRHNIVDSTAKNPFLNNRWGKFLPLSIIRNPEAVKNIQQTVVSINQLHFQDSLNLENEEFMENMTDGGGSLTAYFQNGEILKIKEWIGLSNGIMQHSYYYKNEQLVYVLETEEYFAVNDSMELDYSKLDKMFRGDFYFQNNKLIDIATLGHNRFEDNANDPEKEFLKNSINYKKIILHKGKKRD
jgi:hypothetical protein